MITKEVREWLKKVERKQYSYNDAMEEFTKFIPYLTKDELQFVKSKLLDN